MNNVFKNKLGLIGIIAICFVLFGFAILEGLNDQASRESSVHADTVKTPIQEHTIAELDIQDKKNPQILQYTGDEVAQEKPVAVKPKSETESKPEKSSNQETKQAQQTKKQEKGKIVQANASQSSNQTMYVTATAYTAYCDGCSGVTYTGIDLRANPNQKVIAVDPNVIPLGSKVWVEGYGTAIAGDTGSAIKGNRIDLFIPNHDEAVRYGVKEVKIEIIE